MEKDIRVLIADADPLQRASLVSVLQGQGGIELVGQARNGAEAIVLVEQLHPHLLLCDLVLPEVDGLAVLSYIRRLPGENRPAVIALTACSECDYVSRAIDLGAAFYMVKPVDQSLLLQRIRQLFLAPALLNVPQSPTLRDVITGQLLQLGIPAHMQGYHFIRQALLLVMDRPELMGGVTHQLYPEIARAFHTTPSRVERSIRHAIRITWERGGGEALGVMMDHGVYDRHQKPTNCELIALLAERLRCRRAWL